MPTFECPRGGKAGFVRRERVFKAGRTVTDYFCGRCDAFWTSADQERRATVRIVKGTAADVADRSR